MTVSGDTFNTGAVSVTVRPPQNLNSTTWLMRASNVSSPVSASLRATTSRSSGFRQLARVIEAEVDRTATAFLAVSVACELDEDPSHHLRRQSQKVRPILELDAIDVDQPEVRLVHQRRRLQRMIRSLLAHVTLCQTMELVIDERHEPVEGRPVALRRGEL
jgi:hypothetical protein